MTRRHSLGIWSRWSAAMVLAVLALAGSRAVARLDARRAQDQTPTFRASVDLVAVNVQVIDRDGRPVPALTADKFEVTIAGKKRRVVSASFLQTAPAESTAANRTMTMGAVATNQWPADGPGRTFMLAVDLASFGVEDSRGVVGAARGFVQELQPNDLVGLYAFPVGPKVAPTADHAALDRVLNTLVGSRQSAHSEFDLSASEIIDINAEITASGLRQTPPSRATTVQLATADTPTLRRVEERECGGDITPNNVSCADQITSEASSLGLYYEAQVLEGLSQLHGMLQMIGSYQGHKTVIVLSAGMPTSDRPGGRPDVATAAMDIGRNAAEANANVYAVYIDSAYLRAFSAETRRADKEPPDRSREDMVEWRLLDQFTGAAGGTLIRVMVGDGEGAFDRVLRETSAYYLLGVEPTDADRDGRTRELKVKVNAPGTTVRSRTWVALPKKN